MSLLVRVLRRLALRFRTPSAIRQLAFFVVIGVVLAFLLSGRLLEQFGAGPASAKVLSSAEPPAVTAVAGTPEAEIQAVILKGNREQEQAIATKNSAAMRDTSTDEYFQQIAKTNDDMVNAGIKAIRLTKIEWGEISINGNSATATTWETWVTDLPDGSTDQSRDRNSYTLARSSGVWRVQSDDHPDIGNGIQLPNFFNP